MGRKKRDKIEFRFYELPQGESVLGLMGERWVGMYGHQDRANELHFHNLFELGCCRQGTGSLILGEKKNHYHANMISMIPANYPHNTVSDEVSYWEYLYFDPAQLIHELFPNNARVQAEKLSYINQRADLLPAESCEVLASTLCNDAVIALANQDKVFCTEPCELFVLTHAFPSEYATQEENHFSAPLIARLLSVLYEVAYQVRNAFRMPLPKVVKSRFMIMHKDAHVKPQ